jgi:hypothetical protein
MEASSDDIGAKGIFEAKATARWDEGEKTLGSEEKPSRAPRFKD